MGWPEGFRGLGFEGLQYGQDLTAASMSLECILKTGGQRQTLQHHSSGFFAAQTGHPEIVYLFYHSINIRALII